MKPAFFALLLMVTVVLAQQPATQQTGVLRLRVKVKADDTAPLRGLARKRFFLIPGTLEHNRALITRSSNNHSQRAIVITNNTAPVRN